MKYKKKPIEIEAFQYDGDLMDTHGEYYVPQWAVDAWENDILTYGFNDDIECPCELYVKTLEGNMLIKVGDYVIKGVKGELYPCKEDIFEMTYDLV